MSDNVVSFRGRTTPNPLRRLNPLKFQKARRAKAMTQTDLARAVGLTRQAVSAYEQGTKSPEAETLKSIALELGQPASYFVAPEREAFGPFSARTYRAFGAATNKRNAQCDVLTEWLAVIAAYLNETVNFPAPQIPRVPSPADGDGYSDEEIEVAAEEVRSAWGLGVGPIGNLIKLIESRGVFIAHLPVTSGKVNAFSYWSGSRPFIITGTEDTTAARRRFDMAHELGHLVLHQGIGTEELEEGRVLKRVEAEANRFAGAFLLPRTSYPNEVFSTRLSNFIPLKERWKVAVAAQVYRCADLELFSEQQILNLRKQISYNKWRTREPLDDQIPIEMPQMLKRAVRLAVEGGVLNGPTILNDLNLSPEVIAGTLGISNSELRAPDGSGAPVLTLR